MKSSLRLLIAAGTGFATLGINAKPAAALPVSGLDMAFAASADSAKSVEPARCGPHRCHWRRYWWGPGYGFYGPLPWWRYHFGYYPWWPHMGWAPWYYGYYW